MFNILNECSMYRYYDRGIMFKLTKRFFTSWIEIQIPTPLMNAPSKLADIEECPTAVIDNELVDKDSLPLLDKVLRQKSL